mmetsp:Transcript_14607/g.16845  ORF Transcript_14607/g.16845 Transcript_14607/m.16845 type:complete len:98 (+) Transcript_14607:729-1022(+)
MKKLCFNAAFIAHSPRKWGVYKRAALAFPKSICNNLIHDSTLVVMIHFRNWTCEIKKDDGAGAVEVNDQNQVQKTTREYQVRNSKKRIRPTPLTFQD